MGCFFAPESNAPSVGPSWVTASGGGGSINLTGHLASYKA